MRHDGPAATLAHQISGSDGRKPVLLMRPRVPGGGQGFHGRGGVNGGTLRARRAGGRRLQGKGDDAQSRWPTGGVRTRSGMREFSVVHWTWIGMPRCEEMVPQLPIHPSWRPPPSPAFSKGSLCSPYRGVHGVSSTQQISTIPRGLFGAGNRGRARVPKKSKERNTGRAAVPFSGYTWWEYRS